MIKTLVVVGLFILVLSTGLVVKDWNTSEDVELMSEDDYSYGDDGHVKLNPPMNVLQEKVSPYQLKEPLEYKQVKDGSSR